MSRRLPRLLVSALAAAVAAAAMVVAGPAQAKGDDATAVVGARTPSTAARVAAVLRRADLHVSVIPRIGAMQVSGADLAGVRRLLAGDERVAFIEPPRTRTLFVSADSTVDALTGRTFGWALDTVGAAAGLALAPASLPVKVAVVDSGVDVGHPDLAGRIGPTYDVLSGGTGVKDLVGHGTFVTGLISANGDNDFGSRGIAGATTVLPIRITTSGSIRSADAAAGIVRAVDAGAGVVNLSFGGPIISDVERSALAYASSHDVLLVAAAGNAYRSGNPLQYPAAVLGGVKGGWSPGLSVAATDPAGRHAPFSTANDFVSVAAPGAGAGACGDGVFSTLPATYASLWDDDGASGCNRVVDLPGTAGGRYGYGEGTSFAAPLVAGAAALVRDANPRLTAEQTADVIRRSAHQTLGSGWNPQTGTGVLDAGAAVALARVYDTVAPAPGIATRAAVGRVTEEFTVPDAGVPGGAPSGVATYALERSTDGVTWTGVAPTLPPARYDETPAEAAQRRWFRATVCDVAHNCATRTFGPIIVRDLPAEPPEPPEIAAARPRLRALSLARPATCRACLRVTFTTRGAGRARWSVTLSSRRAGVRTVRRHGTVRAGRRVSTLLPLSRIPACGGRITVTARLGNAAGADRETSTLRVRASCRPLRRG